MSEQQASESMSPEINAMMQAYIADAMVEFGKFVEDITERVPVGAVVTANLTSFVQMLAVASFENGRTAAEAKEAMAASILGMQEYVDEIYVRLQQRKDAQAQAN